MHRVPLAPSPECENSARRREVLPTADLNEIKLEAGQVELPGMVNCCTTHSLLSTLFVFSCVVKRWFRTWVEACPPLLCGKSASLSRHTCSSSAPTSQILTAQLHSQHFSLYISVAATLLVDCLYSLQKRNDHVWSFCRYTVWGARGRQSSRKLGEYTELILPEAPSVPGSVKQPYRMKMPVVTKHPETMEQPYQSNTAEEPTLAFQACMQATSAERQHDIN